MDNERKRMANQLPTIEPSLRPLGRPINVEADSEALRRHTAQIKFQTQTLKLKMAEIDLDTAAKENKTADVDLRVARLHLDSMTCD